MAVDLREVTARVIEEFRAVGYRHHVEVYNVILAEYGAQVFSSTKLVKMVASAMDELYVPDNWQSVILSRWFDDKALCRAGYSDLVD